MKKPMFTISIIAAVAIGATFFIFSQSFFSTDANAIETYTTYEQALSNLFVKYSDTMTEEELATWQNEVDQTADKAANALIRIQEDPDQWREYLASTGQPYRPSPFAPLEFTGFAAKSPKEVTSDEFYDWLAARDKQMDDRRRARLKADGIWDDEKIEQMIADTNEALANDPERQANREKWRQTIIWNENYARERAERDRRSAENQAKLAEEKAWRAAEEERLNQMPSDDSEMSPEAGGTPDGDFDTFDTSDGDFDTFESLPPLESAPVVDEAAPYGEGIETSQPSPLLEDSSLLPPEAAFNADAFASTFSEDMSHWDDVLRESYQDVFQGDASFEARLPREARSILNERRQRLQSEYVRRIDDVLRDVPEANRGETLGIVRERLSETWGSDFTDAVIDALEHSDD